MIQHSGDGNGPVRIVVLAVVAYYVLAISLRRMEPTLARTALGARIAKYLVITLRSWLLATLAFVVLWVLDAREEAADLASTLDSVGLNALLPFGDFVFWSGAMLAAGTVVSAIVGYLRRWMGGKPTDAAIALLPVTPAETAVFSLIVSPTAGICEEFVFRGFVMGELWGFTGNGWIAAGLSSVLFGLGHYYQGAWGMFRTGLMGFVFATGVVMTGSLVPSVAAHAFANMLGASFRYRSQTGQASLDQNASNS